MTKQEASLWLWIIRGEYLRTNDQSYEDFLAEWYDQLHDWLGSEYAKRHYS